MADWQREEGISIDEGGNITVNPIGRRTMRSIRVQRKRKRGPQQQSRDSIEVEAAGSIDVLSSDREPQQSITSVSVAQKKPRTAWNPDLTNRFMEELAILYRNGDLNTTKAAVQKPALSSLATIINDEGWFNNQVSGDVLVNKYDAEKKRYNTWASIAYKSGNTYDEESSKVSCSDEAKKDFLGDHPRQEWVFDRGLGLPAPYQEIWSTTIGKGNSIQSAAESAESQQRERESSAEGSSSLEEDQPDQDDAEEDNEDVDNNNISDIEPENQENQSHISSPQSTRTHLSSSSPSQQRQSSSASGIRPFSPVISRLRRKALTAAEANTYVSQSIQELGTKYSDSRKEVMEMKLRGKKERQQLKEAPSRDEIEVTQAMADLARFKEELDLWVYLAISNKLVTKEKRLVVSRARY